MKRFLIILMSFCLVSVTCSFANAAPILKADASATAGDGDSPSKIVNNSIIGITSITVPIVLSITAKVQQIRLLTPNSYGIAQARADYGSLGVYVSGSGAGVPGGECVC